MDLYTGHFVGQKHLIDDVYAFSYDVPGLSWQPGAHIHIGVRGFEDDRSLVHHMSIVNQDGPLTFWTRLSDSQFKKRLFECGDVTFFKCQAMLNWQGGSTLCLSQGLGLSAMEGLSHLQHENVTYYHVGTKIPSDLPLTCFAHRQAFYQAIKPEFDHYIVVGSFDFVVQVFKHLTNLGVDESRIHMDMNEKRRAMVLGQAKAGQVLKLF